MKIDYDYNGLLCSVESNDNSLRAALFNNKAGFFTKSFFNESKYDGLFVNENGFYKILDSLKSNNSPNRIINFGYKILVEGNFKENFLMPKNFNSLIYHTDKPTEFFLDFDVRKCFDFRNFGRHYSFSEEQYNDRRVLILKFEKRTNSIEDSTHEDKEYEFFIAIIGDINYEFLNQWVKKEYGFDKLRNSDFTRYVFRAFRMFGTKIVISCSMIKEKAVREANFLFSSFNDIEELERKRFSKFLESIDVNFIKDDMQKIVFINCANSIHALTIQNSIFAGFPWFFQNWSRDELISLKAYLILNNHDFAKRVLIKNLMLCNGCKIRISNENQKEIFEPTGILFLRLMELLQKTRNKSLVFSQKEIEILKEKIKIVTDDLISKIDKNFFLIENSAFETWMDTISREGFRIEIQALALQVLETALKVTNEKRYERVRKKLLKSVRKNFLKDKVLIDGLTIKNNKLIADKTLRNNIFLAYYYYPKILSNSEWEVCFQKALKKLFSSWGGISSIDKKSKFYVQKSTGESPLSYHNGDSWYFINNIAAISLSRVNHKKFNYYIIKLLNASMKDNLLLGVIGSSSEISSSIEQENLGCFIQAWSNATLLELIHHFNHLNFNSQS